MESNVQKAMERGEQMNHLEEKTNELEKSASEFKANSVIVKKQMFWKNVKFQVILLLAVILVLAVGLTLGIKSNQENKPVENKPVPAAVIADPKTKATN